MTGVVLSDRVKRLDWQARRVEFAGSAPDDVVTEVRQKLRVLLGV